MARWSSTSTRATTRPGCTKEACQFNDNLRAFSRSGAKVVGISPDTAAKHTAFRTKFGLKFPLLSDPTHAVMEAYGAWGEKTLYGKQTVGDHPLHLPHRRQGQGGPGLVLGEGRRPRRQGPRGAAGGLTAGSPTGPAPALSAGGPGTTTSCGRRPWNARAAPRPRAATAGPAFGHQVPGVRAAALEQLVDGGPQMAVEPAVLGHAERPRRPGGCQPRPPQHLVGQQVAHPGQAPLVEQPGLERRPAGRCAGGQRGPQLAGGDAGGVGPQRPLVGVERHPAEAPRVVQ